MHLFPSFLSDGRRFIYLRVYRQAPERSGLYVGDLTSESSDGEMFLMATGFNATYVSAADAGLGVLLFLRDRSLCAQRFDDKTAELWGKAVKLADGVGSYLDYAYYSASEKLLAYRVPDHRPSSHGSIARDVPWPRSARRKLSPALRCRLTPHSLSSRDIFHTTLSPRICGCST